MNAVAIVVVVNIIRLPLTAQYLIAKSAEFNNVSAEKNREKQLINVLRAIT